jgi:hypothetical protein
MPEAEVIANNHHDEEVSISDAESVPDQGGGDSDPSDADDDDAGARGTGPGPPALTHTHTAPWRDVVCARACVCCMRSRSAVLAQRGLRLCSRSGAAVERGKHRVRRRGRVARRRLPWQASKGAGSVRPPTPPTGSARPC